MVDGQLHLVLDPSHLTLPRPTHVVLTNKQTSKQVNKQDNNHNKRLAQVGESNNRSVKSKGIHFIEQTYDT